MQIFLAMTSRSMQHIGRNLLTRNSTGESVIQRMTTVIALKGNIIIWMKGNYPDYVDMSVLQLSDEQLIDPTMHYHKNTEDLRYEGINVVIILGFFADHKLTSEGKFQSHSDMRKFHDAILYGAGQAKEILPQQYYLRVDTFLNSYKKQAKYKKQNKEMTENESDAITFPLYKMICKWALDVGSIFLWVFTILI